MKGRPGCKLDRDSTAPSVGFFENDRPLVDVTAKERIGDLRFNGSFCAAM